MRRKRNKPRGGADLLAYEEERDFLFWGLPDCICKVLAKKAKKY